MLAHGCCKKLAEDVSTTFWTEFGDIRMRSVQSRFFVVVNIEHDSPLWSVRRKMFHHLHQSDDPHRVIGRTGRSGN